MLHTYTNKQDINIDTMNLLIHNGGDVNGYSSFNGHTNILTVSTSLDKSSTDLIVNSYSNDALITKQVKKAKIFKDDTSKLSKAGMNYHGLKMACRFEDKAGYSSIIADETDPYIPVSYPLQFPSIDGGSLVIADHDDMSELVNATNDRLIYLYEDQDNIDGSKGMTKYLKDIYSAPDEASLDSIIDTRV